MYGAVSACSSPTNNILTLLVVCRLFCNFLVQEYIEDERDNPCEFTYPVREVNQSSLDDYVCCCVCDAVGIPESYKKCKW